MARDLNNDRDATIAILKAELKRRSDRTWSVRGGRGTGWGWIDISAPPRRLDKYGAMSSDDVAELERIFGVHVHDQGISIPASNDYRSNYIDMVRGLTPMRPATPYWD